MITSYGCAAMDPSSGMTSSLTPAGQTSWSTQRWGQWRRDHRSTSSTTRSVPSPSFPPLTLTPPHIKILDEPSAVAAAERQQHDKECLKDIEEAKSVAARWVTGGGREQHFFVREEGRGVRGAG